VDPIYAVLLPFAILKVALAIGILWWALRTQPHGGEGEDDWGGGGPDPPPRPLPHPPWRRQARAAGPHGSPLRRPRRRERSAPV
jgi:hypothetical protein